MRDGQQNPSGWGRAWWIWHGDPRHDLLNAWMQARLEIRLRRAPRRALLRVTADTAYRLHVNGRFVHRGPARGFQASWPYDAIDIAPWLRRGRNVLGALVHNLGLSTSGYVHQGYAGFLLAGRIGGLEISTGPGWRVRPAPGFLRTRTRCSIQMGFQEFVDARLDDGAWLRPGYDAAGWLRPRLIPVGAMPWHALEERGIPLLFNEEAAPAGLALEARGTCAPGHTEVLNVVAAYLRDSMKWQPTQAQLLREGRTVSLETPPSGRGRYSAWCFDFGREIVGCIRIGIAGAAGTEIVDTIVCEALGERGPVIRPEYAQQPVSGCLAAFGNRLWPRRGDTAYETFDPWGFRYLVVVVRDARRRLKLRVGARTLGYPLKIKGAFHCSSAALNSIYTMCVNTQRRCMLDAYVDCPWREQAQWWGDARIQAANTFVLSADARLLRRGIRQLAAQEVPNGLTYGLAPTGGHHLILPDFTLTWMLTLWDYYWQTGEMALFRSQAERAKRALAYFESMAASNGLLPADRRYWLFLDWCPLFRDGYSTVYNLLYLLALEAMERMFGLVGDSATARGLRQRREGLRRRILGALWDRETGAWYGGLRRNGRPARANEPHACALAMLAGLQPRRHAAWIEERLLPVLRPEPQRERTPSPFFMHYVFEALHRAGRRQEVIDCIERWWGGMLARGLTTTEEHWNAEAGHESLCHAWSAHPVVHLSRSLLGVEQIAVAWRRIRWAPLVAAQISARGRVATPGGVIECGWERTAGAVRLSLKLPAGMRADVAAGALRAAGARGSRQWEIPYCP